VIGNWILLLKKKYFVLYIILKKSFSTEWLFKKEMPAISSPTSRWTQEMFGITHKTNFCKYIEIDITQNIW